MWLLSVARAPSHRALLIAHGCEPVEIVFWTPEGKYVDICDIDSIPLIKRSGHDGVRVTNIHYARPFKPQNHAQSTRLDGRELFGDAKSLRTGLESTNNADYRHRTGAGQGGIMAQKCTKYRTSDNIPMRIEVQNRV